MKICVNCGAATFVWAYVATMHNGGKTTGRIEAANGYEAKVALFAQNELIKSIVVKVSKDQVRARKEPFIKGPCKCAV